jgi:uncharacterized protein (DUF1919 family)
MLFGLRQYLARWRDLALTRQSITIISDDCWGAEFYRLLRIPYLTPSVGLYVECADYLDFVSNLGEPDAFQLQFVSDRQSYPVVRTPYATLHCMHYSSEDEVRGKIRRRASRINWKQLFIKVDFGKPEYTAADVSRWNEMKLPNSLAIIPESSPFIRQDIWNGISLPYWEINGARMFQISRNFFDFPYWTRTGKIRRSIGNRFAHGVVLSQIVPNRIKKTLMG